MTLKNHAFSDSITNGDFGSHGVTLEEDMTRSLE